MKRRSADILFVVDASNSMEPCIQGVINNITQFTDVFKNDKNLTWDLRFDFIAHRDMAQEDRSKGIDKDFRERVVAAGGQYDDVDFRASLIWNNRNDLDLHVRTPAGNIIYFGNKKLINKVLILLASGMKLCKDLMYRSKASPSLPIRGLSVTLM